MDDWSMPASAAIAVTVGYFIGWLVGMLSALVGWVLKTGAGKSPGFDI